jgi:large subunit ribosomal protein L22
MSAVEAKKKTAKVAVSTAKRGAVKKQPAGTLPTTSETTTSVEVKAAARFIRMSPKKIRLIIDQVRGKSVMAAEQYLDFVRREAAEPVAKLLKSAVANASHNFELDEKDLFIKKIIANDGPTIKRYRPRAFGRAATIRKRTTHIELILSSKTGAKIAVKKPAAPIPDAVRLSSEAPKTTTRATEHKDADAKKEKNVGGAGQKGFLKKVFNRKTG